MEPPELAAVAQLLLQWMRVPNLHWASVEPKDSIVGIDVARAFDVAGVLAPLDRKDGRGVAASLGAERASRNGLSLRQVVRHHDWDFSKLAQEVSKALGVRVVLDVRNVRLREALEHVPVHNQVVRTTWPDEQDECREVGQGTGSG